MVPHRHQIARDVTFGFPGILKIRSCRCIWLPRHQVVVSAFTHDGLCREVPVIIGNSSHASLLAALVRVLVKRRVLLPLLLHPLPHQGSARVAPGLPRRGVMQAGRRVGALPLDQVRGATRPLFEGCGAPRTTRCSSSSAPRCCGFLRLRGGSGCRADGPEMRGRFPTAFVELLRRAILDGSQRGWTGARVAFCGRASMTWRFRGAWMTRALDDTSTCAKLACRPANRFRLSAHLVCSRHTRDHALSPAVYYQSIGDAYSSFDSVMARGGHSLEQLSIISGDGQASCQQGAFLQDRLFPISRRK